MYKNTKLKLGQKKIVYNEKNLFFLLNIARDIRRNYFFQKEDDYTFGLSEISPRAKLNGKPKKY